MAGDAPGEQLRRRGHRRWRARAGHAYYLAANHGITDVAVLEKSYLGSGGSGRNTAILRSNYLTPEGVVFYDRSLELYGNLATDLNMNVMFSQRGHITLAHSDASLRTMHWRAR